jgi:hypothetical protein
VRDQARVVEHTRGDKQEQRDGRDRRIHAIQPAERGAASGDRRGDPEASPARPMPRPTERAPHTTYDAARVQSKHDTSAFRTLGRTLVPVIVTTPEHWPFVPTAQLHLPPGRGSHAARHADGGYVIPNRSTRVLAARLASSRLLAPDAGGKRRRRNARDECRRRSGDAPSPTPFPHSCRPP